MATNNDRQQDTGTATTTATTTIETTHHLTSSLIALSPRMSAAPSSSSSDSTSSEGSSSSTTSFKAASGTTSSTSIAEGNDLEDTPSTSHPSASSDDTSSSSKTSSTKDATKIEVLASKPGYHKEIRTSSTGNKYLLETKGLWTTLHSLTPIKNSKSTKERLKKKLLDFITFWPFLLRFAKEVINLGKFRFLLHLIASTLTGLAPALRIYLYGKLIGMAQEASERRIVAENNGILQRRFQAMVSEHLISARARLDVHTLGKSRVIRDFQSAASLIHSLGDGTFVIGQLIDLFTSAVSLITQSSMLWKMTSKENADLALISVFSASITMLRWFWRGRRGYSMSAITDPNYNRMTLMEDMSHPSTGNFGERKVLGLGDWVHDQFKKASNALGDVSLAPPRTTELFTSATEAIRTFSDTAIIVLFSLKVSEKSIEESAMSMSSLTFIQSSTRNLASSIYRFIYDLQHFGDELSAFKSYYRVLEIKSAIKEPAEPRKYETLMRRCSPTSSNTDSNDVNKDEKTILKEDENDDDDSMQFKSGMEVEFRDVCYTWPGRKEKALDHISFTIKAGELTAIVGYNGAGKSTIIALIARLCDPSSGEILINGYDIRSYKTSDLHNKMSFLFQSSSDLPLTIQEYIGIGNLNEINNLIKIRQAAIDSGAIEFIEKLEDGFQSSFTGQVEIETPDTLYKDAVAWDKYLNEVDNEDDEDEDDDASDTDDDDGDNDEAKDDKKEKGKRKSKSKSSKKKSAEKSEKNETDGTPEGEEEAGKKAEDVSSESDSSSSSSSSDSEDQEENSDSEGRLAFSGGQRQKIILARSFLRDNCDLAIFDEYSANLDPLAEHSLFQKITAKRGKQTLLYITHRYSTVRHADHILMLERGKVVESGTHEELMAIPNGKYAEMSRLALGEVDLDNKARTATVANDSTTQSENGTEGPFKDVRFDADEVTAINTPLPMSRASSPEPQ